MSKIKTMRRGQDGTHPRPLAFGTSGLRGLVTDITDLEAYINAKGFLRFLLEAGDTRPGGTLCVACDLRPSSDSPERSILRAVVRAIEDSGLFAANLGRLPTPALTYYAMRQQLPSIMVTGSHIPFDRNGIKFNKSSGEILKSDEAGILRAVAGVREEEYARAAGDSPFDSSGMIRAECARALPPVDEAGRNAYLRRYLDFFAGRSLKGRRILVYQHSAVGRDLLVELLAALGAEALPAGRSDRFIPIDTEDIQETQLAELQQLVEAAAKAHGPIDTLVSTDGDSDRPLFCAIEPGGVRFLGGDLLGTLAADFLGAQTVVVPISANDAVDRHFGLRGIRVIKTRIGSPYVIQAMEEARRAGATSVVGWEANGGFLTGTDIERDGQRLAALPTRDAALPMLAVLFSAAEQGRSLAQLFDGLPRRYSRAGLIDQFPMDAARAIVERYSPTDAEINELVFEEGARVILRGADGSFREAGAETARTYLARKEEIEQLFPASLGLGSVTRINALDGVRITFASNDVAHLRPSGNAPQMRIYSNSDTQARADAMVRAGLAEPEGILRRLERRVALQPLLEAQRAHPAPIPIRGRVRHYAWGGCDFIPALINEPNPERLPHAELWFGTHPQAPATAEIGGARFGLDELLLADPGYLLGPVAAVRCNGQLPLLFKLLDVRQMLSIQAHPSKPRAEEGFARENGAGIPLSARERNYRDANHKPEVQVALTEFWMLQGFRPLEEMAAELRQLPEFHTLRPEFSRQLGQAGRDPVARKALLRSLYETIMTLPQDRVDALLNPLIARLQASGPFHKDQREFWVLRAAEQFPLPGGHRDRGIFSIYLLNLARLHPGEGSYQPAGTLHAYLEGVNVELMANSDNVLRGGLTPKHVDLPELLKTLSFESGPAELLSGVPRSDAECAYPTPAREFELSRIEVSAAHSFTSPAGHGAELLLMVEGEARFQSPNQNMTLGRGRSLLIPYSLPYSVQSASRALLFKASIP